MTPDKIAIHALDALIEQFHAGTRLRVWSVVITFFGDSIVPRGGVVGMSALQALTGRLEVAPGALRAAMSRLAKDGWVVRCKHGRKSYYSLAPSCAATFARAGERFYAAGPPDWQGKWILALAPDEPAGKRDTRTAALTGAGFIRQSNGLYLRPTSNATEPAGAALDDMFVLEASASTLPDWVQRMCSSVEIEESYNAIIAAFTQLDAALSGGGTLSPLDAVAARTLLIHDWRRVLLRGGDLPNELRPSDWPGEDARALVKRLYARLLDASENWLDDCDGQPGSLLPQPDPSFERRFSRV